jgi:hypothetical protein
VLPEKVLDATVTVPTLSMAPPAALVEFLKKLLFVIDVSAPAAV